VSFSTGRPVSLLEESIEIPLPDDADFYPDPAAYEATSEPVQPVPFVMLTKLMVHVGRISNVLNGRRGQKRTLMVETEPPQEQLKNLQSDLIELYTTLPPSLRWSVDAFKLHEQVRLCRWWSSQTYTLIARSWRRKFRRQTFARG
jgi:hypothetical protein